MTIETQIPAIHAEASKAAIDATNSFLAAHGDRDCCGFAWTSVFKVRSNSKLGKALIAVGFRKNEYERCLQLWNPSKSGTQAISAKEAGAIAYTNVLRKYGIEAYAGSRLD